MDYNHDVASELTQKNIAKLLDELPNGVEVVAAAKTRTLKRPWNLFRREEKSLERIMSKNRKKHHLCWLVSLCPSNYSVTPC
jgi:hypothetical protein